MCGGGQQICERVTSRRRKRRKKIQMLMMALCRAITATSAQRSIWMRRQSQDWWDQDVAGYTEQEFFHYPIPACGTLYFLFSINFICHLFTKQCSAGQNDVKSRIKCDPAVQIAVALKKNQMRIRFRTTFKRGLILIRKCQIQCDMCCSHCQKQIR